MSILYSTLLYSTLLYSTILYQCSCGLLGDPISQGLGIPPGRSVDDPKARSVNRELGFVLAAAALPPVQPRVKVKTAEKGSISGDSVRIIQGFYGVYIGIL